MSEQIVCKTGGFAEAARMIRVLELSPADRRRWLARRGRMVIAQARKNTVDQKNIDGTPYTPRKDGSAKPMLRHVAKSKWLGLKIEDLSATVFYPGRTIKDHQTGKPVSQGYIAAKHQQGSDEEFRRAKYSDVFNPNDCSPSSRDYWGKFCDEKQAKILIQCGFRKPLRWIMDNVTVGHGFQFLENTKESWRIRVPARSFLGVDAATGRIWADELFGSVRDRFRAKNYTHLLK